MGKESKKKKKAEAGGGDGGQGGFVFGKAPAIDSKAGGLSALFAGAKSAAPVELVVPERKTRVPRDRPKKKKLGAAADANADADAPAGESVEQAVGGGKAAGAADGAIAAAGKSGPVVLGSESARKASKTQAAVLRRKAAKEAKEGAAAHPVKRSADDKERNTRTIFVGNLPVAIKPKHLRAHFREFGTIESIRLRSASLLTKPVRGKEAVTQRHAYGSDQSSVNAYVVFETKESAEAALARNGTLFHERHLRVDRADGSAKPDHKRSIFVGNLAFDATEEQLISAFQDYGDVESARVIRDPKTSVGKGFGYVLFRDPSSVGLAVELNDTLELAGRKLRISRSSAKVAAGKASRLAEAKAAQKERKRKRGTDAPERSGKKKKGERPDMPRPLKKDAPFAGLQAEQGTLEKLPKKLRKQQHVAAGAGKKALRKAKAAKKTKLMAKKFTRKKEKIASRNERTSSS